MYRALLAFFCFTSQLLFAAAYDEIVDYIDDTVDEYPQIVEKFELTRNDMNETIWGVRIASPHASTNAKEVLVVGVHHGNERLSAEVAVSFINQAVSDILSRQRSFLSSDTIYHVIPVLNINGYNNNERREKVSFSSSLDPNRDYPDPCGGGYLQLRSTNALANYLRSSNIVGAVTIHGYIGTFTFPWGTYTSETQTHDHEKFIEMAHAAAEVNNYRIGTHADEIYPTAGVFEDWAYHEMGIWVSLIELNYSTDIARDAASIMTYFEHVPDTRSNDHNHLGDCRRVWGPIIARP